MKSFTALILIIATAFVPVESQDQASLFNSIHAYQSQLKIQTLQSLLIGCSIFPLSMSLECSRIQPPLTAYMASDFIAANYTEAHYNTMMWLGIAAETARSMTASVIKSEYVNASTVVACSSYTFPVNSIEDLIRLYQQMTADSTRALSSVLPAITHRESLVPMASLMTSTARANVITRLFAGGRAISAEQQYDIALPFAEAAATFAPYEQNCSNVQLEPFSVRPLGSAHSLNGGTNFTGSLSAFYNMQYTSIDMANDIITLNFLLTMHRAHAAYFDAAAFRFSGVDYLRSGRDISVAESIAQMSLNEMDIVNTLTTLITQLSGSADSVASPCTYNFEVGLFSISSMISNAQQLLDISSGVSTSLSNALVDTNLQQTVTVFAVIGARQAAYMSLLRWGWMGGVSLDGRWGMGLPAVPFVEGAIAPNLWMDQLSSTDLQVACPNLVIPQKAASEEPGAVDVLPPASTGMSTNMSMSSSSTGLIDSPNTAAGIATSLLQATFCVVAMTLLIC